MRSTYLFILTIGILLLFMGACDKSMVFDEFHHISDGSWGWDEKLEFEVEAVDTSILYDMLINLRHSTDYPFSNLYMFVHVSGPSGQSLTDTINFRLAENSGKWLGKGLGNSREIGFLYRKNTAFPQSGKYHFVIEQAMRQPEIPVTEVGLRIEKHTP